MFPVPFNERRRLQALASYDILDTAPEEALDTLTRIACRTFSVPIALVCLVDSDRQWFKSCVGLDASETPRKVAFCTHAIVADGPMVIHDARQDSRFRTNPLVTGAPGIRFYAGAPLITREGFRLGTFCVIDVVPRPEFCAEDIATLEDFARTTMRILEMRQLSIEVRSNDYESLAAQEARKEVFALVAHEIRSPVATLISLARTIEARIFGPLAEPRYADYLADVKDIAEQVGGITDRMLDFARLNTGEIELKEKGVSVVNLLEAARRAVTGLADSKNVSVEVEDMGEELMLSLDPILTLQMVTNLLTNAVKFSPVDGRVSLAALKTASGEFAIEISDNGPGISDEAVAAFSEERNVVGQPTHNSSGGTGLGLPLVKLLVELHGGRVVLTRGIPHGTVATLLFPAYRILEMRTQPAQIA